VSVHAEERPGAQEHALLIQQLLTEIHRPDLADDLKKIPGVEEGHYTDGDYDVILKVVTASPATLMDVLNTINAADGVANTKTIISLTNPIREF